MRVLVISDNHGEEQVLTQVCREEEIDHIIHCGDFCTSVEVLPERQRLTVVRGNCDFADVPDETLWEGDGYRFFVTHGHRYQVKASLMKLAYRAAEVAANIVCFGHSHEPFCQLHEGRLFINPGSIVQPRGYTLPTYAVLQTATNDRVHISYYTPDGDVIPELGGNYTLNSG